MSGISNWFGRLSTTAKLWVILSAAILPLGLVLAWVAAQSIDQANRALVISAQNQSQAAMRQVDGLIARNVMALRISGNAAVREPTADPCAVARQALSMSPGVAPSFALRDPSGRQICSVGQIEDQRRALLVAPGAVSFWLSPSGSSLYYRVGLVGGNAATGVLSREDLRNATAVGGDALREFTLSDGWIVVPLIDRPIMGNRFERETIARERSLANGQLTVAARVLTNQIANVDRGILLLPLLMWLAAAAMSWYLVSHFLIRPLRTMQRAVAAYEPGSAELVLPEQPRAAVEIRELGQSFARAVERIEHSEKEMAVALEGQRKLVREVHHRVKNNLQVIASLLNIHGRSATTQDARDAYSAISRRVDALAVVHRNHYAELEENRGIALRPLLNELAASLRVSAPDNGRSLNIDLDVENLSTVQDAAVATAFFVTEVVEFAMLRRPDEPVELSLRRSGELTARFALSSSILNPEAAEDPDRKQFERIIGGLAKQLRSPLDRKLGRYSVDLPVFPPR